MSHYMQMEYSEFFIPTNNLDRALDALKALNTDPAYQHRKHQVSPTASAFHWISPDYHRFVTSAQEVFELLGYETELNDHGLVVIHYDGKAGDESLFFGAVAHLVSPGSFIHFRSESGSHWRLDFDGRVMLERDAELVFK